MNETTAGVLGIVVLVVLFLFRVPVAFAMGIVGLVGFAVLSNLQAALSILSRDVFEQFSSYPLTVISMFVLMGCFAFASGISKRLYDTGYAWVGQLRGGLTIATVIACALFAAICGSTAATAATVGKIALPEMKRYKYDDTLATGTVAGAGTLGIMIPPSTIFIVYGILTEQSIGKLFIAGVLPGAVLALLMVMAIIIICWRNPSLGPPASPTTWGYKLRASMGITEAVILFFLVIGGLFLGWFSPTQAGAIGACGALIIGLFRKELSWASFFEACKEGLRTSCMIIFIITGATIFGHFMAVSRITFDLAEWVGKLPFPPSGIMAIIIFIYFLGGCFMDSMALVVLTIPIFYPVAMRLGFDPIWFGVMIVLVAEMGVITPPVGVNVYVIKGISDVPLETIFKGVIPFLLAQVVCIILICLFPIIATLLPSYISY